MENLYVLFYENRLVGVYTSHRKAMQTMLIDTINKNLKLNSYTFDFGVEFFEYIDSNYKTPLWELHEVTPDARA